MKKKTKATSGGVAELASMGSAQLQKRYTELFGRKARTCNLMQLRGEIARKLLECEGAVTTDAPIEVRDEATPPPSRDARLPRAGSFLRREHDGVIHRVKVLEHAFVYQGAQYRSLSAIVKVITGTTWNGYVWFGLAARPAKNKTAGRAA